MSMTKSEKDRILQIIRGRIDEATESLFSESEIDAAKKRGIESALERFDIGDAVSEYDALERRIEDCNEQISLYSKKKENLKIERNVISYTVNCVLLGREPEDPVPYYQKTYNTDFHSNLEDVAKQYVKEYMLQHENGERYRQLLAAREDIELVILMSTSPTAAKEGIGRFVNKFNLEGILPYDNLL